MGRKMYLCTLFNGYLASLKFATHYSTVINCGKQMFTGTTNFH